MTMCWKCKYGVDKSKHNENVMVYVDDHEPQCREHAEEWVLRLDTNIGNMEDDITAQKIELKNMQSIRDELVEKLSNL